MRFGPGFCAQTIFILGSRGNGCSPQIDLGAFKLIYPCRIKKDSRRVVGLGDKGISLRHRRGALLENGKPGGKDGQSKEKTKHAGCSSDNYNFIHQHSNTILYPPENSRPKYKEARP